MDVIERQRQLNARQRGALEQLDRDIRSVEVFFELVEENRTRVAVQLRDGREFTGVIQFTGPGMCTITLGFKVRRGTRAESGYMAHESVRIPYVQIIPKSLQVVE